MSCFSIEYWVGLALDGLLDSCMLEHIDERIILFLVPGCAISALAWLIADK